MTTRISVSYDRKFSDGNSGSEGVSFSTSFDLEPDEHDNFSAAQFATVVQSLRYAVLLELSEAAASERMRALASRELHRPMTTAIDQPVQDLEDLPF
jgi:hypothetical protein